MKKTVIASLAVLASAAVLTTFALGGTDKFGDVQVHADPVEPSVTFDAKSKIEEVGDNSVISTTTAGGNKVGVVGIGKPDEGLSFCDVKCHALFIFDQGDLEAAGAYEFGHITGFTVDFDGSDLMLSWNDENDEMHGEHLESGTRFNVTFTPYNTPIFEGGRRPQSSPSRSTTPARGRDHPRIQADAHVRFGFFLPFGSPANR